MCVCVCVCSPTSLGLLVPVYLSPLNTLNYLVCSIMWSRGWFIKLCNYLGVMEAREEGFFFCMM